jgi:hypothetical protein
MFWLLTHLTRKNASLSPFLFQEAVFSSTIDYLTELKKPAEPKKIYLEKPCLCTI